MNGFANKTIAITGAGSGIGRALALKLAAKGARLGLSDINQDSVDETRETVHSSGGLAESWKVDVTNQSEVETWIEALEQAFGPTDFIINNAGVTLLDQAATQSLEDVRWIMDINFWGVVHGVNAVLPGMVERRRGHIVNISSLFGLLGIPSQSAYNASKFAVRGYTEALGHEVRPLGISVSCVHPGGIRTGIAQNARFRRNHRGGGTKERFVKGFAKIAKTSAEEAAHIILEGVEAKRKRILVGSDAHLLDKIQRLFPERYGQILRTMKMM